MKNQLAFSRPSAAHIHRLFGFCSASCSHLRPERNEVVKQVYWYFLYIPHPYVYNYNIISSAECKIALSQRPIQERPISTPGSRTPYLGARFKNALSRRSVEEWPISAPD